MTEQVTPPGKPASSKSENIRPQPGAVQHAHWDEAFGEYIHTHRIFDKSFNALPMADHKHGNTGNQKYLGETSNVTVTVGKS